ncbi:hypothetical protein AKJ66_04300 [candidate division MSBL1 archaeon SCGC-AAA259E22]|uniref:Uncharacterized protein n=2 Tax=candidate division MSBL1 TaxID=215777 RepID=A0A133U6H1_9EURY|nr:hypothetical protein AKJ61_02095 [candidate division MSBL1 archaeon SCGC-AAA259B11]KXA92349.1 hypothetical protein AKJ66_04300 [candidate division MSBL1 archaeon SCGC-AAA259E22]
MPIICLFGPDGSGKSTLANMLARKFQDRNRNVKVSWMRGSHTVASVLAKLLSNSPTFRGDENPYYDIKIPEKMRRLWQIIEFMSALPVILLRFVLPALLGRTVVCDRYVPDFVVWVALTTDDREYPSKPEARFLLKLSTKCDYRVYVYASQERLEEREKKDGTSLGSGQAELYSSIAKSIGANKVDTTHESPNESLRSILDRIEGEIN